MRYRFLESVPDFGKDKMPLLKAMLAILIVADHLTFWVDSVFLLPFRELGAPIVSLFFFVSGYGLVKSFEKRGEAYLNGFFVNRVWKVILPSLVALVVYWLLCFDIDRNYFVAVRLLVTNGVPLLPYSWYVASIVILYVVFYTSFKWVNPRFRILTVFLLSIVYIVAIKGIGYDRCWWVCTLAFPTGLLFSKHETWLYSHLLRTKLLSMLVVSVMLAIFSALYIIGSEDAFILCYVFIPLVVVIIYSWLRLPVSESKTIRFLSSISYEIYLCQGIAMEFLRRMIDLDVLYCVAVYIMTLALAYFVNRLSCKLVIAP